MTVAIARPRPDPRPAGAARLRRPPPPDARTSWLVDEAYLLDTQHYDTWLDLLTDDIHYLMPVRVTTALGAGFDTAPGHGALRREQVLARRAGSPGSPPSTPGPRTRRRGCATTSANVRTFATDDTDDVVVESAVLLFRSRGDVREPSLISAGREDLLRRDAAATWLLARRTIMVDESVLRTQNLAIFL